MRLTPPSTTAGALPRCGWSGSRPGWQNMIGSAASVPQAYLLYCLEYVLYIQTHVYHRCSPSQLSPGSSPTRVLSRRGQGAYADPRQPDLVGTGADRGPAPRPP